MTFQNAALVASDFELSRGTDGNKPRWTGYVNLFDSPSDPELGYAEEFAPGAFSRALKAKGANYTFVIDHNDRLQVATTKAGNLHLAEDSRGLFSDAQLPNTSVAQDLIGYYEAGMVRGMSFRFQPQDTVKTDRGVLRRTTVRLGHVTALVSMDPVYPATGPTVQIRALAGELEAAAEDLDSLFDGIREGRSLTDTESSLLDRLATHFRPVITEPEPEADRALDDEVLAAAKAVIASHEATK